MMKFSTNEVVYRASKTVVQLIRNHVEEERGGIHSRLFSHMLHPERDFVCIGQSDAVKGGASAHPEHLVPCTILIQEVRRLLTESRLTDDEIAALLQKHWKIALISKEQARHIDFDLGYKSRMPDGWMFETGETLARLQSANISLVALNTPSASA
jgi:hypothetical protein